MENKVDWSKMKKGDILGEIPYGTNGFLAGGIVEKVGEGGDSNEGLHQEFWIRYENGLHKFYIIGRKIHSVTKVRDEEGR